MKVNDVTRRRGHRRRPRRLARAVVTMNVRTDVELPDNADRRDPAGPACSEKFVSLGRARGQAREGAARDGAEPSLERTGRNPEVEEVLGALSLMLNGGGIAQLQDDLDRSSTRRSTGREGATRSVLEQIRHADDPSTTTRPTSSAPSSRSTTWPSSAAEQQGSIDAALEELPERAGLRWTSSAADLVTMLRSASASSATSVSGSSSETKTRTISSPAPSSEPTLRQLAQSGDAFVKAFNVFLTYPFVDEVVGRDPQVAPQPAHGRLHQPLRRARPRPVRSASPGSRPACRRCCPASLDPTKVVLDNVLRAASPAGASTSDGVPASAAGASRRC